MMPAEAPDIEAALQRSEAKFATIFRACPDIITITDLTSGLYLDVNEAFERGSGFTKAEVLGRTALDINIWETPAERGRIVAALTETPHLDNFEARIRHKSGEVLTVLLSAEVVVLDARNCLIIVCRDISDRKREEETLRLTAEQLERSNIELERFAHVAAHDLQEPCRTICSYAQLLQRHYAGQLDQDGQDYLEFMVSGALRMRSLIQGLLTYSRLDATAQQFVALPLNDLFDEILDDLKSTINDSHAEIVVARPLPTVRGEPSQLRQLLINLVSNAIKFRTPERVPKIEITAQASGDDWLFSVIDNGIGIPAEFSQSVFEVFRRLHGPEHYPGSGIGLALCKRIVESHGGHIWIGDGNSEDASGCAISFTLPKIAP